MKKSQATITIFLAAVALLAVTGCKKHKPDLPPQAQAPAVTEPPAPAKDTTPATPDSASAQPPVKPSKPPVRSPRNTPPRKPAGNDKPQGTEVAKATPPPLPPRIVIQQGGRNDAASSAPVTPLASHDDAAHSQASTAQLMQSTEANLAAINRHLSADEQSIVTQIGEYMNQSRQAGKDGDLVRARNLALKAHLLSDELVKPR
jgi:hypothetical protein